MRRSAETLGKIRPAFFCFQPLLNQFLAYHKSRKNIDFLGQIRFSGRSKSVKKKHKTPTTEHRPERLPPIGDAKKVAYNKPG